MIGLILSIRTFSFFKSQNIIAGALFLDLSKALDIIDHTLLIHKLKLYNIDTSRLPSYLSNRFQQTLYFSTISDKREVLSGVP